MKKPKKVMKNTTDSRVYKMAMREIILGCPMCPPNKGCNRNFGCEHTWKNHRDNQWKD